MPLVRSLEKEILIAVCKLFQVANVSDCFGYVFSRPIFNKHFIKMALENVHTIDEHRSKIFGNRDFDCRLSPNWRQLAIENIVSRDL